MCSIRRAPRTERALLISEATYGPHHPQVAVCLSNLSNVHMNMGQPVTARLLVERALAIGEAT